MKLRARDAACSSPCEVVPPDTNDDEALMECDILDTRTQFLHLCQGNHYQFDTLRRAKHSSMMALYHLHNPSEPAFVGNCNMCQAEIEPGAGWRCKDKECQDFDMCRNCHSQGRAREHAHPLVVRTPSQTLPFAPLLFALLLAVPFFSEMALNWKIK